MHKMHRGLWISRNIIGRVNMTGVFQSFALNGAISSNRGFKAYPLNCRVSQGFGGSDAVASLHGNGMRLVG